MGLPGTRVFPGLEGAQDQIQADGAGGPVGNPAAVLHDAHFYADIFLPGPHSIAQGPYPLFAYAALVVWTYFAQALTRGGTGLVTNANLISKVYFPRIILLIVAAATPAVDMGLAMIFLVAMLAWFQVVPSLAVFLLPLFMAMAFLAAFSIGLWLSALNVRYRDIGHLMPFLVQFGVLASPVAYPASLVPLQWQGFYALNPMVAVVEGFKVVPAEHPGAEPRDDRLRDAHHRGCVSSGLWYFKTTERTFGDII